MRMTRVFAIAVVALGASALGLTGCKTSDAGVEKNPMTGTISGHVGASPERATAAAREAMEELGLKRIDATSTQIDGQVTAYTAREERITVDIKSTGQDVSTLTVKAGKIYGDTDLGQQLFRRIREKLGGVGRGSSDARSDLRTDTRVDTRVDTRADGTRVKVDPDGDVRVQTK